MKEYIEYLKKHPFGCILVAAVLFLCYGIHAFSTYFYIDSELLVLKPYTTYNWLETGRFSLPLLRRIAGLGVYDPYMEGILFLLFLFIASTGLSFLLTRGRSGGVFLFAPLLFLVSRNYEDAFYFHYLSHTLLAAFILLIIADRLFLSFLEKGKWQLLIAGCICQVLSFGVYQLMANIQISLLLSLFILSSQDEQKTKAVPVIRDGWLSIAAYPFYFLGGFLPYEVIAKLFFSGSSYLNDQILWGQQPFKTVVQSVLSAVKLYLTAPGDLLEKTYPATALLLLVTSFLLWKKHRLSFWTAAGLLGLFVSPLFLPVIMGKILIGRTQLTMPLVCSCLIIVCIRLLEQICEDRDRQRLQHLGVLFCTVLLYMQALVVMRLYYTEKVIRDHDAVTTAQMIHTIDQAGGTGKPLVFVGYLRAGSNASCYHYRDMGSYMCLSAYALRADASNLYNTRGILAYYETLGFHYPVPTMEMMAEGEAASTQMPDWPAAGSVRNMGDYTVIRLSADNAGFAEQ